VIDLKGRRILVLEDEPLIAMFLEDILTDLGCIVIGPALDIAQATTLVRDSAIDAAILDVNVGDSTSQPVADLLRARNIPFLVASGYNDTNLLLGAGGSLGKPFRLEDVERELQLVLS